MDATANDVMHSPPPSPPVAAVNLSTGEMARMKRETDAQKQLDDMIKRYPAWGKEYLRRNGITK